MTAEPMNPPGRYEPDYCTACGQYTERRLMSHIPHLCDECLFNQHPDKEREPDNAPWSVMLEELHSAAARNKVQFFKPFGKNAEPWP